MLHRKIVLPVALMAFVLLASPAPSRAEGLINSLPDDGSWVLLKAKSELDFQGNLQTIDRELKISSVGKQEVEGRPARWIEVNTEFFGQKILAKFLIEEKYFKPDQDPFEHIAKGVARGPNGEVADIPDNQLRRLMVFVLGVPHFAKPEKQEKEKVKTDLGEFECAHVKGETEVDGPMDAKLKMSGEIWTNDKVPFGLVKAKIKGDLGLGSIETDLQAVKSGKDAKSEIQEAK